MSGGPDVLSASRKQCYKARDEFYACVDGKGAGLDDPIPKACKKLRKAYEASCKESWVKHFDKKRLHEQFIAKKIEREAAHQAQQK